jgi:Uri superfamily endonuclease
VQGIYVLIIEVAEDINIKVGALGTIAFQKGSYAYVGSAQTSIEQRIKRHFRKEKRKFWHIDYLLDNEAVTITKVLFKREKKTEECKISKTIDEKSKQIADFGSSDCNCKAHLYHIKNYKVLQETMETFPHKHNAF